MLCHPVLALFIRRKWKRVMKYFLIHTVVFLVFLITYYLYIKAVFETENEMEESNTGSSALIDSDNETTLQVSIGSKIFSCVETEPATISSRNQEQNMDQNRTLLPHFLGDMKAGHFVNEILFLIMTTLLFCLECFQFCNFGMNYFKQWENLHQLIIILTAIIAMVLKPYTQEGNIRGESVRGAIAVGFCLSCFEFIFVVGKYPFRGGDFSIMFSRVLRKLARYVIAMFMIVAGFSVGLNVITYGTGQAFQFENPFKSFVLTLTMAMGEFNADTLYQDYDNKLKTTLYKDLAYMRVGRTIAMIILVGMILTGTITMINLFVAVIISDKEKMEVDVFKQKLFYMAEGSELIKNLVVSKMQSDLKVEEQITVCVHKICGPMCTAERVSPSIGRIVPKLIQLAKKNENKATQCASTQCEEALRTKGQ